ncbi:MAG: phosphatidylserine decarboxylase [Gammaproteobacteria bacterium]|nr:phosphatidylserine decarboxylase [Gammaproteobacteria bacterium]
MSLFTSIQSWLPHHLISRLTGRLARSEWRPLKRLLIRKVMAWYDISLSDFESGDPDSYASFNAFFTRALKAGARPLDAHPNHIVSPVDGTISQLGTISGERVFQAKNKDYSASTLLGDAQLATIFANGLFITAYLAPHNYHRIHMPLRGILRSMQHIPGRLFSVNAASVTHIDQLFARNERVVCTFDTRFGPMAMIMVGALNVGSIETCHAGVIAPRSKAQTHNWSYAADEIKPFDKGQEFARFNLGSTVILMFADGGAQWLEPLSAGQTLLMGQQLGTGMQSGFRALGLEAGGPSA